MCSQGRLPSPPSGGTRETLNRLGFTYITVSDRTEHGVQFVELDLIEVEIVEKIGRKGLSCSAASTNHPSTVLGSISNTRAVPRMPKPSARQAMTCTMRSGDERLP